MNWQSAHFQLFAEINPSSVNQNSTSEVTVEPTPLYDFASIAVAPSSTPLVHNFCSRKPFVTQSKRGQNKILCTMKKTITDVLGIKNEDDIDHIALKLISSKRQKTSSEALKAHIRGLRASRIYAYFQSFRALYDEEKL